jgi:hypothetical protein
MAFSPVNNPNEIPGFGPPEVSSPAWSAEGATLYQPGAKPQEVRHN